MKKLFLLCLVTLSAPARHLLLILLLAGGAEGSFSQWSINNAINTPVCTATKYQYEVRVIPDGKGGAIAAWKDHRNDATFPLPDTSNADIYVQRLDKNGYAKWTLNGIPVCVNDSNQTSVNMVTDGASGAIIIWRDTRNSNNDIYAQKIDSSGNIMWTAGGVPVCNDPNNQKGAKAISDGAGGVIVSYEYKVSGNDWDIYVQRLDANGNRLWAPTSSGKKISTSLEDEKNPRIETDENGGAIVVWTRYVSSPLDYDIYAQKINASGAIVWTSGGVPVCYDAAFQVEPKIEPDGSAGAIIVWQDSTTGGLTDIYAQRISSSTGANLWNGGVKVAVCTDLSKQTAHDIASEGINGIIIAWKDFRNGSTDIYAQKIDLNGVIGGGAWILNGIPIANSQFTGEGNPNLWGDGAGGALCVYQDTIGPAGNISAQKIDTNGNLLWGAGAPVATAAKNQTQPKHVPDGAGGLICFFQDNRDDSTNSYDIYAHHLYSNGTTNGINEFPGSDSWFHLYPNPFSESATLQITNNELQIENLELKIINVFGQEVRRSALDVLNSKLERGNLASGLYFYEIIINTGNTISTGKFIVAD